MSAENKLTYTYGAIAVFPANCKTCGHNFPYPLLGEMLSYGEFIANGQQGGLYRYLSAFTGEWDEITRILGEISPTRRAEDPGGDRLQWIIGKCTDPVDGQELSIVSGPICPQCQSRDVLFSDIERLGFQPIPDVTWNEFHRMTEIEKREKIIKLWHESRNA